MQEYKISVIIPVGNGAIYLGEVLNALSQQTQKPFEVVIVDDRVTDSSLKSVQKTELPIKLIKTTEDRYGVSSARNIGAENARGDVIVFIDSDVILNPDALYRIAEAIKHYDGVIGVQSKDCGFNNISSRYKNQWMRWTYIRLKSPVSLFYTSFAVIKRELFIKTGGFDEMYKSPSIEDTAFGNKLSSLGFKIHIDKQLEYIHKRRYNLIDILKTDFGRSRDLTYYFLKNINVRKKFKTSVPIKTFVVLPIAIIGVCYISVFVFTGIKILAILGFSLLTFIPIIYIDFIKHISIEDGCKTALLSSVIIIFDMFISSIGAVAGLFKRFLKTS